MVNVSFTKELCATITGIITLCLHGKILHICEDAVHVLLQIIQCIWEVVIGVLLFGGLVISLASDEELFGGSGSLSWSNLL